MSDFDENAAAVQEALEAARRVVGLVVEYFDALIGAGLTRQEALVLTRDYQRQFLGLQSSGDSDG